MKLIRQYGLDSLYDMSEDILDILRQEVERDAERRSQVSYFSRPNYIVVSASGTKFPWLFIPNVTKKLKELGSSKFDNPDAFCITEDTDTKFYINSTAISKAVVGVDVGEGDSF